MADIAQEPETAEVSIGHIELDPPKLVDGEPVVEDRNDTYYEYDGKRYWHDFSKLGSVFIVRDGKYSRIPDESVGTAETDAPQITINTIMESFNEQNWKYIGSIEQEQTDRMQRFYIDSTGDTMLCIIELDPEKDGYSWVELGKEETLVGAIILRPSVS